MEEVNAPKCVPGDDCVVTPATGDDVRNKIDAILKQKTKSKQRAAGAALIVSMLCYPTWRARSQAAVMAGSNFTIP